MCSCLLCHRQVWQQMLLDSKAQIWQQTSLRLLCPKKEEWNYTVKYTTPTHVTRTTTYFPKLYLQVFKQRVYLELWLKDYYYMIFHLHI